MVFFRLYIYIKDFVYHSSVFSERLNKKYVYALYKEFETKEQ